LPISLSLGLCLGLAFDYQPAFATSSDVIELNNEGVKALNSNNFTLAIEKFQEALKKDANYQLAKDNLAIAFNNYGSALQNNPKEAIKQFHPVHLKIGLSLAIKHA
jgi:lipoprotein NlpI